MSWLVGLSLNRACSLPRQTLHGRGKGTTDSNRSSYESCQVAIDFFAPLAHSLTGDVRQSDSSPHTAYDLCTSQE